MQGKSRPESRTAIGPLVQTDGNRFASIFSSGRLAILAADMVGYSTAIEIDEVDTLAWMERGPDRPPRPGPAHASPAIHKLKPSWPAGDRS
ncbi:hypothetical protein ACWGTI_29545 [Mesorhizobium sp. ArgA1]